MKDGPDISRIAALIGDPARANILNALMAGKALTAGELANEAGVMAATASGHLAQMVEGGLLTAVKQGRHRYYRLADESVAEALETLSVVAAGKGHLRTRTGPRDPSLRRARVCYDHLAGEEAVRIFASMAERGFFVPKGEGLDLSDAGHAFVADLGLEPGRFGGKSRPTCRACLDWSERRDHLAGRVGAALLDHALVSGWARRIGNTRHVDITPKGAAAFERLFPG